MTGSGDGKIIFPAGKRPEQSTKVTHGKTRWAVSGIGVGMTPASDKAGKRDRWVVRSERAWKSCWRVQILFFQQAGALRGSE